MTEETRYETVEEEAVQRIEASSEEPTGDAEKGALMGGVGGLVAGAMAGAVVGPGGAVIGAIVGGVIGAAASGAAVAAVDRIDDDTKFSGLPDDMSFQDGPDREPMVIDRTQLNRQEAEAPLLDDVMGASEVPIGLGMPEAIAITQPAGSAYDNTTPPPIPPIDPATYTDPANAPVDRGGVSGDAETDGTLPFTDTGLIEDGWDRDNDSSQIDVNPTPISGSEAKPVSDGYAYADNPDDDRQKGKSV